MPHLREPERIVFAHVPKTGGMWARKALGLRKLYGAHGPPYEVAWMLADHRVVAQIRDPWSWYGSLYLHLMAIGLESVVEAWGNGSTAFADVLHGWTHLEEIKDLGIWELYGPGPHPEPRGGLWSWTYETYLRDLDVTLVDLAQVVEGWGELLAQPIPEVEPINVRSDPSTYTDLYDDELRALVAEADAALIEHCGYDFLAPASAGATITWPARAEG